MKTLALVLFLCQSISWASPLDRKWPERGWEKYAAELAVQSGGRVKPFDTFAREGTRLLTGREKFESLSATEFLFSLLFEPQFWRGHPFLQIEHKQLKADLGLEVAAKRFSPEQVWRSERLMPLFGELQAKLKNQDKLDPYFQGLQRLNFQIGFYQELLSGGALRLVPPTPEKYNKSDAWSGFAEFTEEQKLRFTLIAASFTSNDPATAAKLPEYIQKFRELAESANPKLYPAASSLDWEIHFNRLHPFFWAWVTALSATIFLAIAFYASSKIWERAGFFFLAVTFVLQTYGFVLRCLIAGRPPVTNMYESVLFVAFGCLLFGIILELFYRKRVIALASLIFCTLSLIVADNVSGILDASIQPLEPVLRSNLWLTVHVLTITLGYAAFALSLVLGNIGLGQIVFFGKESANLPLRQLAFFTYRAEQVGVVLLAAGTILGGVWADYSWGRFWGWDPKETWALIALLGYLALLHARFRGMVGPFGFLAASVLAFMGVLMAWYGVNFVLGAGLHSYGFSSGGVSGVATYCTMQLLFVGYAILLKKKMQAS